MSLRTAAIGDVATLNRKAPVLAGDNGAMVPFLPMAAVREDGGISREEQRPFVQLTTGYTYFEKGDILLAKITPCFENGKIAHLTMLSHSFGFGSTEFHVLTAGPEVDPRYLYHALRSPHFRKSGAASMTGSAGQQRVPSAFLSRYRISLAPLPEQRRIAAALDKADAVRRKRRESLRLSHEFLRSVFLEMFGDPAMNEKGWGVVRLGDCLRTKPAIGTITPASASGEVKLVRVGELGAHDVALDRSMGVSLSATEVDRFDAVEDDLLLARAIGSEEHLGKASVMQRVAERVAFDSHVMRLRFDTSRVKSSFVWHLLQTAGGRRLFLKHGGRTAVQFNINASQVCEARLPLPPISEQDRFLNVVARVSKTHMQLKTAGEVTGRLLASLSHAAYDSIGGLVDRQHALNPGDSK